VGASPHSSGPVRGSRFQLELEVSPVPAGPAPARRLPETQRTPHDCHVLLVDDNSVAQLVVRGMLLKLGYRVKTVDSGPAAMALLQDETFDAVLLDIPEQIRALPGCAELPVIALSSSAQSPERSDCHGVGVTDRLAKPVRFDALQAMLHIRLLSTEKGESADI